MLRGLIVAVGLLVLLGCNQTPGVESTSEPDPTPASWTGLSTEAQIVQSVCQAIESSYFLPVLYRLPPVFNAFAPGGYEPIDPVPDLGADCAELRVVGRLAVVPSEYPNAVDEQIDQVPTWAAVRFQSDVWWASLDVACSGNRFGLDREPPVCRTSRIVDEDPDALAAEADLLRLPVMELSPLEVDGLPDLTIEFNATAAAGGPCLVPGAQGYSGGGIVTLINRGNAASPAVIEWQEAGDQNEIRSVQLLRGLEPGESVEPDDGTWRHNGFVSAGTVIVDPRNQVAESSEENNTQTASGEALICR